MADQGYRTTPGTGPLAGPWPSHRSSTSDPYSGSAHDGPFYPQSIMTYPGRSTPGSATGSGSGSGPFNSPAGNPGPVPGVIGRPETTGFPVSTSALMPMSTLSVTPAFPAFNSQKMSIPGRTSDSPSQQPFGPSFSGPNSNLWDLTERYSPTDSVDDIIASPNLSDYALESSGPSTSPSGKPKPGGKGRGQRRPSNRDEFDGPHQFLQRPPPEYIAQQERELPHLPTNLHVQEQDIVLSMVNDRLSRCAYDFVAKYQFPIPLTQDMRPVERPQDREWTEWVYLLKRLATKRRIPARVLYNGQIKQFVTILENSLEMRHAAKHLSRPLKDDRNILQLISAGIQVAKLLRDAEAMAYMDRLYVSTEKQIQERAAARTFR